MTTPLPELPNTTQTPDTKASLDTLSVYAADGAKFPTTPASSTGADTRLAADAPPADQYRPASHWLGSGSTPTETPAASKDVVDGYVVGGAMLEAGLATTGMATLIARGMRTGDDGRLGPLTSRYGIGTNGRDILARYGNLGAMQGLEPDQYGRLIPVTRIVRVESLVGATDAVTGKKNIQIDLSNPSLSLDATHQAPYVEQPGRKSFYDTFNTPLGTHSPTQGYLDYHEHPDLSGRGILDHVEIVAAELRAHQHATETSRVRGSEIAGLVRERTIFSQELKSAGDELRKRVIGSDDFKEYIRLRTNEDLFERSTLYNGIGDEATFQKHLFARRFLAGSTVMGVESLLYDAKNTGLGIHSFPGIAMTSFSAGAWGMAQSASNNDKAWKVGLKGAGWGIGTGLALSALGLFEGGAEYSNTKLGGLLHVIPEPTETEALFIGGGMAIPTKNVASKFGVIGVSAALGWGASQVLPHPIESLLSGW